MVYKNYFTFSECIQPHSFVITHVKISQDRTKRCSLSFIDKQVKFFLENKINKKKVTVNATNNVVRY